MSMASKTVMFCEYLGRDDCFAHGWCLLGLGTGRLASGSHVAVPRYIEGTYTESSHTVHDPSTTLTLRDRAQRPSNPVSIYGTVNRKCMPTPRSFGWRLTNGFQHNTTRPTKTRASWDDKNAKFGARGSREVSIVNILDVYLVPATFSCPLLTRSSLVI